MPPCGLGMPPFRAPPCCPTPEFSWSAQPKCLLRENKKHPNKAESARIQLHILYGMLQTEKPNQLATWEAASSDKMSSYGDVHGQSRYDGRFIHARTGRPARFIGCVRVNGVVWLCWDCSLLLRFRICSAGVKKLVAARLELLLLLTVAKQRGTLFQIDLSFKVSQVEGKPTLNL